MTDRKWDTDVDNGDIGILYDRHGDWIPFPIRANHYTGDVVQFEEDGPEEMGGVPKINYDKGEAIRILVRYAAPLVFVPIDQLPRPIKDMLDSNKKAKPV